MGQILWCSMRQRWAECHGRVRKRCCSHELKACKGSCKGSFCDKEDIWRNIPFVELTSRNALPEMICWVAESRLDKSIVTFLAVCHDPHCQDLGLVHRLLSISDQSHRNAASMILPLSHPGPRCWLTALYHTGQDLPSSSR